MSSKGYGFPTSDIGQLRKVLLHRPGPEIFKVTVMSPQDHPALPGELMRAQAIDEHDAFARTLAANGVQIVWVEDLLDDAIAQARAAGVFGAWLAASRPTAYQALTARASDISGAALVGARDDFFYTKDGAGKLRPLFEPMKWMFYAHDLAVMTPRGAILCNFPTYTRAFESSLARLLFDHARALQQYPVAFDAVQEDVFITGGDVIVADENTLLVGTGNTTEGRVAPMLARKLGMDVIEVRLPGRDVTPGVLAGEPWIGLHLQFYNLDTIFGFVDTDKILALPYILEAQYAGRDPLTRILEGLRDEPGVDEASMDEVLQHLAGVGWVTRYEAGSGQVDATVRDMKLVDYLRDRGYTLVPVGGEQGALDDMAYMMERVLRETRFQAANVTALAPGKVIAFEENEHTIAALRAAGVDVLTVPGYELVHWNGGPHAMTNRLE